MKTLLNFVLLFSIVISADVLSHEKHKHKKKEHSHSHHDHDHKGESLSAHVHGEVQLSLAVDGQQMALEIKSPAESLLGFEHRPKNEQQKTKWSELQASWKKNLWGIIEFPEDLKCTPNNQEIQMKADDGHADIEASALIDCQTNLASKEIKLIMMRQFASIKKLKVDVLPSNQSAYSREIIRSDKKIPEESLAL